MQIDDLRLLGIPRSRLIISEGRNENLDKQK